MMSFRRKKSKKGTKRKQGGSPGTLMQLVSTRVGGTKKKKSDSKK
jgi:hypothetical protein